MAGSAGGLPLGQWTADARRFYARGDMDEDRVTQLEKLGMAWSHFDVAWEEGLAAARKGMEIEQRRAEGLPVESSAGAMPRKRRE
ncbi:helicase associated domain-containing protein [Streptomyces sp. NBC_01264]|uniref:helicase associated domain-containing protein n=1 Tax=Streptomyces sp. NBC_01264 TaxID=2903804 RepID=UPI003D2FD8BF